jgi:hypothetical protein
MRFTDNTKRGGFLKTFRYILGSLLIAGLAFAAAKPQKGGEDEKALMKSCPIGRSHFTRKVGPGVRPQRCRLNRLTEGNLYLAEVFNGRVQKLRPKAGAERARLVAQTTHSLTR